MVGDVGAESDTRLTIFLLVSIVQYQDFSEEPGFSMCPNYSLCDVSNVCNSLQKNIILRDPRHNVTVLGLLSLLARVTK